MKGSDLSLADVEFLQAVREINKNPENYPETDRSEVPANTASIKRATELTSDQVSYRMGGNQNSRGFEDGKNPLIKTYDPVATDTGYAPRAAEVTMAGRSILSKAQKIGSRLEGITRDEFNKLATRIEHLQIKYQLQNRLIDYIIHEDDYLSVDEPFETDEVIVNNITKSISATLSTTNDGEEYIIEEKNGDQTNKYAIEPDPRQIAKRMFEAVTQY